MYPLICIITFTEKISYLLKFKNNSLYRIKILPARHRQSSRSQGLFFSRKCKKCKCSLSTCGKVIQHLMEPPSPPNSCDDERFPLYLREFISHTQIFKIYKHNEIAVRRVVVIFRSLCATSQGKLLAPHRLRGALLRYAASPTPMYLPTATLHTSFVWFSIWLALLVL